MNNESSLQRATDSFLPVKLYSSHLVPLKCNGDLNAVKVSFLEATGMCSIHLWTFCPATPHSWRAVFVLSVISVKDNTFLLFVFGPYLISAWITFPLAFWISFNQAENKNVDVLINFTSLYRHLFSLFCNLA